jgi:hypothetical protein
MSTANAAAVDNLLRAVRDLVEDDISELPLTQDLLDLIDCLVATVTTKPMADTEYVGQLLDRLRTRSNEAYESFRVNSAPPKPVVRGVSACMR